MLISINDIKVKNRVRKDLGNVEALKDSLKRYGLMNPITLNSRYELIAGQRRLEAAKQLGWTTIQANILERAPDKIEQLEMELEENTQRSDFTDEELMAGYAALEKLRNPGFFRRLLNSIKNFFTSEDETDMKIVNHKKKKSLIISFLLLLGLIISIAGSILYKNEYIGSTVRITVDLTATLLMLVGLLNLARFFMIRTKHSNSSQLQKI